MFIEVLTEGASDVPVVREVLVRQFGLSEHVDFRIHPHRGRGNMPTNPLAQSNPKHRGLFDQLPAKLRGFGKYMDEQCLVLVLVDVYNCLLSLMRYCLVFRLDRHVFCFGWR